MDQDTFLLLGYATLTVLNRAVFVGDFAIKFRPAFYLVQLFNIIGSSYLLAWGIPSFQEGPMRFVNYMLAAMLILHSVKNNAKYEKLLRAVVSTDDGHLAKRKAVLDKLKKTEEE
jgi:hypothetical protein